MTTDSETRNCSPVLTAPVSAVSAVIATVERVPARSVPSKPPPAASGGGLDGTERLGTRSDGRKQGRNSADGCGEDRALIDECRDDSGFGKEDKTSGRQVPWPITNCEVTLIWV